MKANVVMLKKSVREIINFYVCVHLSYELCGIQKGEILFSYKFIYFYKLKYEVC